MSKMSEAMHLASGYEEGCRIESNGVHCRKAISQLVRRKAVLIAMAVMTARRNGFAGDNRQ